MQTYVRNRPYAGPVQAVVLDWAGTAVDFGCLGPVAVFLEVFSRRGVAVTPAQARKPMGLMKKDHIRAMLADPEVAEAWTRTLGKSPDEADVEALYAETEPLMVGCIAGHAEPIPGLLDAVAGFRSMGLKIGSSTGYTGPMMAVLTKEAAKHGYSPDAVFCSTDVPRGRPLPWMCYRNAMALETWPMEAMVKIGDTIADIREGLNAGMWTIGLTLTGNELGLTEAEVAALDPADLEARLARIDERFMAEGVHYTARSIADCPALVARIGERLARGGMPFPRQD